MTKVKYLRVTPETEVDFTSCDELTPYKAIVIVEAEVSNSWRSHISDWLVESGCYCMSAWGEDCSYWDDSVDTSLLEKFNFQDIPDSDFIMTTWHEDCPIEEVFEYANNCGYRGDKKLENTLILHISASNREVELL